MSPRAFTCPTCNAAPLVQCRRVLFGGRILTRAEMGKFLGNNADGEAILDEPADVIHLARANMANRAEKAAAGKRDADWNVSNLYAEKPDPEPERKPRSGKQTTIGGRE